MTYQVSDIVVGKTFVFINPKDGKISSIYISELMKHPRYNTDRVLYSPSADAEITGMIRADVLVNCIYPSTDEAEKAIADNTWYKTETTSTN